MPLDLAILGAGCAGLSMAWRLAEAQMPGRIALFDPRDAHRHDRSWGYWAVDPHPFRHLEVRRWTRWRLRHRGREVERRCAPYPYALLPAEAYYRAALSAVTEMPSLEEMASLSRVGAVCNRDAPSTDARPSRLQAAPTLELHYGSLVQALTPPQSGDRHWRLRLADGREHQARRVADTRPVKGASGLLLWQHFLGQWVRLPRPVFDPEVVTLMDFDVAPTAGIHFLYLLPLAPDLALVADTHIGGEPLSPVGYAAHIRAYLRERYGVAQYLVEREEPGAIPMRAFRPPANRPAGLLRLGGLGGAIKPSSGYAFLAIQRQAEAAARWLTAGDPEIPPPALRPRSSLAERLDRILLWHMQGRPEQLPAIFFALFERVAPEALIRFLSDCPRPDDYRQVIAAMPTLPMLTTALRRLPQWLP